MADYVELANSYYRLLRWVEASEAEKKNTAFRSLDRIKRFLSDSNVEVVDLTGQPFSEGWAVKVMKMDDSVPENELVFTKMVKPIIQVNGELMQEGEVYVGKIDQEEEKVSISEVADSNPDVAESLKANDEITEDTSEKQHSIVNWFKKIGNKVKSLSVSQNQWIAGVVGIIALIVVILVACTLGGQSCLRADVADIDKKVDELAVADYRNQLGATSIITYEVRNGDSTIIVTQPIGEMVTSTVEVNDVPVTITTNANITTAKGE